MQVTTVGSTPPSAPSTSPSAGLPPPSSGGCPFDPNYIPASAFGIPGSAGSTPDAPASEQGMGYVDVLYQWIEYLRHNPSSTSGLSSFLQYVQNLLNYLSSNHASPADIQAVQQVLCGLDSNQNPQSTSTFFGPLVEQIALQQAELIFLTNGANAAAEAQAQSFLQQFMGGGSSNSTLASLFAALDGGASTASAELSMFANNFISNGGLSINGTLFTWPANQDVIEMYVMGQNLGNNPLTDGAAAGVTPGYFLAGIDHFANCPGALNLCMLFMTQMSTYYDGLLSALGTQMTTLSNFSNQNVQSEIQLMNSIQAQLSAYQQQYFSNLPPPGSTSGSSGSDPSEAQQYNQDYQAYMAAVAGNPQLNSEIDEYASDLASMTAMVTYNPILSGLSSSWASQVWSPFASASGSVYTIGPSGGTNPYAGSSTGTFTIQQFLEQNGFNGFATFFAGLGLNAPATDTGSSPYIAPPLTGPSATTQDQLSGLGSMATAVNTRSQTENSYLQYDSSLEQAAIGLVNFTFNPNQTGGLAALNLSMINNQRST